MSLDLAWDKLDAALSARLVEILNKQLAAAPRPSFIGPVEVTGLDFGTVCPDIEVVDMRDIYRDFLEDDESDEDSVAGNAHGHGRGDVRDEEDEYEWVPRRDAELAAAYEAPTYHPLPPHLRYGYGRAPPGAAMSVPNLADLRPGLGFGMHGRGMAASMYATPSQTPSPLVREASFGRMASQGPTASSTSSSTPPSPSPVPSPIPPPNPSTNPDPNGSAHPNIQLHLRILHHSDLRLTLSTSLLINYPAPLFLSLPIKLAVTGLEFAGEVVLAYEGAAARRRVHFCLLDDLDPYGLATGAGSSAAASRDGTASAEPAAKPLPVGQRLLPSIFIESEIGQADKHVLKNVTRVERFIQDVIRKTVEDELVFPNFHTLVLGE